MRINESIVFGTHGMEKSCKLHFVGFVFQEKLSYLETKGLCLFVSHRTLII